MPVAVIETPDDKEGKVKITGTDIGMCSQEELTNSIICLIELYRRAGCKFDLDEVFDDLAFVFDDFWDEV